MLRPPLLKDQYPILYNIVQHKDVSVHQVLHGAPPMNISFRRTLTGNKWEMWSHLVLRLLDISLTDVPDSFHWKLTKDGVFSVKSMYEDLMNGHTRFLKTYLWKLKIPLKIKIFIWFLNRKVLLTKYNLAKRNWKGSIHCAFCGCNESIDHLFLSCPFAKLVWRVVFCTYNIPPPTNVSNIFGNWLNGWIIRPRLGFA